MAISLDMFFHCLSQSRPDQFLMDCMLTKLKQISQNCAYGFGEVQIFEIVSGSIAAAGEKAAGGAVIRLAAIGNTV